MNIEEPYEGQKFESFQVLKKYLEDYGEKNYVKFWTRSSHTINSSKSKTKKVNPELKYACIKFACIFGGEKSRNRGYGIRKSATYRNFGCPCTISAVVGEDGNHLKLETVVLDHNHTLSKSLYDSLKKSKNKTKILETEVNYCNTTKENESSDNPESSSKAKAETVGKRKRGRGAANKKNKAMAEEVAASPEFKQCVKEMKEKYGDNVKIVVVTRTEPQKRVVRVPQAVSVDELRRYKIEHDKAERLKAEKFDNMCRVCSKTTKELNPIFNRRSPSDGELVSFKIMSCASVHLAPNDGLPNKICTSCEKLMEYAFQFRVKCENTDTFLRDEDQVNEFIGVKFPRLSETSQEVIPEPTIAYEEVIAEPSEEMDIDVSAPEADPLNIDDGADVVDNVDANDGVETSEAFVQVDDQALGYEAARYQIVAEPEPVQNINIVPQQETCTQIGGACPICDNIFDTYPSMLQHLEEHSDISDSILCCNFCNSVFTMVKPIVEHLKEHLAEQIEMHELNTNSANYVNQGENSPGEFELELEPKTGPGPQLERELEPDVKQKPEFGRVQESGQELECKRKPKLKRELDVKQAEFGHETKIEPGRRTDLGHNLQPQLAQVKEAPIPESQRARNTPISDNYYLCTICGKILKSKDRFQSHKNTHEGLKPHICAKCGRGFADRKNMHQHYDIVHLKKAKHECPVCHKKFYAPTKMKSHITMHYGVKPYSCEICNKSFRLRMNMIKHKKTHSNERPHKCDKCKAAFIDRNLLTRHSYVHGGPRPHICQDCGHSFTLKFNLKKHIVGGRCSARRDTDIEFSWENIPQFDPSLTDGDGEMTEVPSDILDEILNAIGDK